MNKNEYRRAVSQVRWSEEQRRNIEARLRALPQNDSEEIRADEEDGFVEVFRMDTKQLRARQREIEKEEKRSRIMGRIGWAVVAAGMVAAVGLFGAFAAKARKLKQDVKYGDQLVTLSTCNSTFTEGRLVVFARMLRDGESLEEGTTSIANPNIKWPNSYYKWHKNTYNPDAEFIPYG